MNYNYKVIIEECEEGGYFAECPAFQGCHVEGESYEETMAELKKTIQAFIEDNIARNEKVPEDNFTIASISVAV